MTERASEAKTCLDYGTQLAGLLDGELSASEQARLEEHLRVCAACAGSLRTQRAVRSAVRLAAPKLSAPVGLRTRVAAGLDRAEARAGWGSRLTLLGAIAAALAVIAVIAVLRLPASPSTSRVLTAAAAAHRQTTLGTDPVSFTSTNSDAVAAWAQSQSGQKIDVPSLAQNGYQLLGARSEPSLATSAISLVYEGPGGRITCSVLPMSEPRSATGTSGSKLVFDQARIDGASVASWLEPDATYVLVGNLPPASLLSLARTAAQQ